MATAERQNASLCLTQTCGPAAYRMDKGHPHRHRHVHAAAGQQVEYLQRGCDGYGEKEKGWLHHHQIPSGSRTSHGYAIGVYSEPC